MKKLAAALIIILLASLPGLSQGKQLIIKKNDKGFFVDHAVAAKEGLYSIGRAYNVHPRTIASFNSLDMNAGLNIGQVIQIPLTDTNFSQKTNKGTPLYYTVKEKEGLLTVSNMNNGVTMQSIRDWNNLKSDKLNAGAKLVVGYLVTEPTEAVAEKPAVTEKKDEPIAKAEPEIKKEEKQIEPEPKKTISPVTEQPVAKTDNNNDASQGYFRSSFDQQTKASPITKNETVTSGIFKTASGWEDAKYYLLMDKVQAGTIVRITNPDNNKAVFAKVLGQMNGIRQNEGLDIRISNAAAAALDISESEKFIVKVNY